MMNVILVKKEMRAVKQRSSVPCEDGQQPISLVFAEHLFKVFPKPEVESIFIGTADTEDGSAESLQSCSILKHQIHMIAE